jgi:LmbE family N-acetylglucosaminyl deacetylase
MKLFKVVGICLLFLVFTAVNALANQPSSVIYHQLQKLKETRRVLFVAAHPDDENTRLIAYLANAQHMEVAYLSLTRGDGGQNLIGKELGIELGFIRTHELLKARATDGGRQLFTRALDFGFSKNPKETLGNWNKEDVLSDVVWIVRNYQPDIIINRFNTIPGTTHGHHTTSAILSVEAFDLAANPNSFPQQLNNVQTWQPHRLFWNAYNWGGQYEPESGKKYHTFPVGDYNPLLGTTYSKIAADSRTMHKSQGFGSTAQWGEASDFIELVKGKSFEKDPFEGLPNRWEKLSSGKAIESAIQQVITNYNFLTPEKNVDALLKVKALMDKEKSTETWFKEKKQLIDEIIFQSMGVKYEFVTKKEISFPGDQISAELIVNNPSAKLIKITNFSGEIFNKNLNSTSVNNKPFSTNVQFQLPDNFPISQPFWLENPVKDAIFGIDNLEFIGKTINEPLVIGQLNLQIDQQTFLMNVPLIYKYNDQVNGEIKQPFTVVPEINVKMDKSNVFLSSGAKNYVDVEVAFKNDIKLGKIQIQGLNESQYSVVELSERQKRNTKYYRIIFKSLPKGKHEVKVGFLTQDGKMYDKDMQRIIYSHIPNLTYFLTNNLSVHQMDLNLTQGGKIGYINGAGDDVADVLINLGYQVSFIENNQINKEYLKQFQTIITGVRAFNVNQALANQVDELMSYVNDGGNLIIQYNTSSPLLTRDLGPYPFSVSRERVTVENSPFEADFSHPILKFPNTLTASDFDQWVQERGLYFVSNWDKKYASPLRFQDPDEAMNAGSLITANYGKGTYTYSGISWFRQLPAGVPGAIKLFVNLIEQGNGK